MIELNEDYELLVAGEVKCKFTEDQIDGVAIALTSLDNQVQYQQTVINKLVDTMATITGDDKETIINAVIADIEVESKTNENI